MKLWKLKKMKIKEKDFSIRKYNQKWQLSYCNKSQGSFTCNKLCKDLGFIINKEDSNFRNNLLSLPNEIIHIILSYLNYYELNIIKDTISLNKSILSYNEFHKIIIYKVFDILDIFQNKIKKICFYNINDFYKKNKRNYL